MDPQLFSLNVQAAAAILISKLYDFPDLPRARVQEITNSFTNLLNDDSITALFTYILNRLKILGESSDNIQALKVMINMLKNPFTNLETEWKCLKFFENAKTYIPPKEIVVGSKKIYKKVNNQSILIKKNISIQTIALREVFKKFFELPGILDDTLSYLKYLQQQKKLITNIVQSERWKKRCASFGDKLVLPLFLYQDDFETNNPLGSHKGLGKLGGVYISIPCLPPHLQSKIENIFLLTLYKSNDVKFTDLNTIMAEAVDELNYLESTGVIISSLSGPTRVYFSVAGVIGDNLAIHTMLGFIGSFSAHHPCRFCLIHREKLTTTFTESECTLRNSDNYKRDFNLNKPSVTGIVGPSVLNNIKNTTTLDFFTVDILHDILEGTNEYDIGLIINQFITVNKFFSITDLNNRIKSLFYGDDEIRNKPREIKFSNIKEKYIKMSAAEALCFIRNIGVIIGDFIPRDNPHWKLCILLKDIIDIVTSNVVHEDLCDYLESLISEYLRLLTTLFPRSLKPKHHFLLHYASMMRVSGPLWAMCTMRCESQNRDFKITAHVSLNCINICKTLAMKHQLRLNYRFQSNFSVHKSYEKGSSNLQLIKNLPDYELYSHLLPQSIQNRVLELNFIVFKSRIIKKNVVLMIPSTEIEPDFFLVHCIIEKSQELFIIANNIGDYVYYDEHFQAYKVSDDSIFHLTFVKILNLKDLEHSTITHVTKSGSGNNFIPKRWV